MRSTRERGRETEQSLITADRGSHRYITCVRLLFTCLYGWRVSVRRYLCAHADGIWAVACAPDIPVSHPLSSTVQTIQQLLGSMKRSHEGIPSIVGVKPVHHKANYHEFRCEEVSLAVGVHRSVYCCYGAAVTPLKTNTRSRLSPCCIVTYHIHTICLIQQYTWCFQTV